MSELSGEAAEQIVRMSLEGTETAVRLAGNGAKELAVLLYAVLKDQRRTRGKIRLTNMLRSGKEIKVFAVKDGDLQKFCMESRKYGVLYTILKDRDAHDGLTDVMVRAEDAGKVNRSFERFNLTTVDMGSVRAEIEKSREERVKTEDAGGTERKMTEEEKVEAFLDEALKNDRAEEKQDPRNPTEGRDSKSLQSGPSSEKRQPTARDASDEPERRPSVKKELETIRREQKETAVRPKEGPRVQMHRAPKKKKNRSKKEAKIR